MPRAGRVRICQSSEQGIETGPTRWNALRIWILWRPRWMAPALEYVSKRTYTAPINQTGRIFSMEQHSRCCSYPQEIEHHRSWFGYSSSVMLISITLSATQLEQALAGGAHPELGPRPALRGDGDHARPRRRLSEPSAGCWSWPSSSAMSAKPAR